MKSSNQNTNSVITWSLLSLILDYSHMIETAISKVILLYYLHLYKFPGQQKGSSS